MSQPEKRQYQRIQFFRLVKDQDLIPVWVFNSVSPGSSIAALVVDMSENGMQVLTSTEEKPEASRYFLHFLGDEGNTLDIPAMQVERIWSTHEQGLYVRTGFRLDAVDRLTLDLMQDKMHRNPAAFIRCSLSAAQ
ncbi:PilZ domain-containing protein [Undibacterium rugosum]|uniref:PilZ domain-containing protein n=1 Tax=Undibacterium rugosum TaxID=2762291 RepID=A0A923I595_9BURK|nr:PilZ domain-containing protein [Undibacterium rugosum]MBC3936610.1 PilZ domain-containing protein [Undibacterium rugosum]MBR7776934.1 PilZ domain-containing protein [Undibacterium rugosum]